MSLISAECARSSVITICEVIARLEAEMDRSASSDAKIFWAAIKDLRHAEKTLSFIPTKTLHTNEAQASLDKMREHHSQMEK